MHFIFYDYFRCCYVRANAAELLARFASNSVAGWSGFGASGVVYSAIGLCTASAVMNSCDLLIRYVRSFRDPDIKETVPEIVIMALNLTLIVLALYLILFARDLFLNASPGIDVFAYTAGFLIGFAFSSALPTQRTLQPVGLQTLGLLYCHLAFILRQFRDRQNRQLNAS